MEFSRQEYWSGLPFPSPEDLPDPGIKIHWQFDSLPLMPKIWRFFATEKFPGKIFVTRTPQSPKRVSVIDS